MAANNDHLWLLESTTSQPTRGSGNVLSNDTGGPWRVVSVASSDAASSPGKWLKGRYGDLLLQADGSYTYYARYADALAQGSVGLDVFTYNVVDRVGRVSSAQLQIHVQGTNDNPVAGQDSATVSEDSVLSILAGRGLLANDRDPDSGDVLHVSAIGKNGVLTAPGGVVHGTYGDLVASADGAYQYRPGAAAQALGAGTTAQDQFVYEVQDANGGKASSTLSINLVGANDRASFGGQSSMSVDEDGQLVSPYARMTVFDLDRGESSFRAQQLTSAYGTLELLADGHWCYLLNNSAAAVQSLAEGQIYQDKFTVYSRDGTPTQLTVNIHGQNDRPDAVADHMSLYDDEALWMDASMGVLANDHDSDGDSLRVSMVTVDDMAFLPGENVHGHYGLLNLHSDGGYTYIPNMAAVPDGALVEDRFSYVVSDGHGGVSSASLSFSVIGGIPFAGAAALDVRDILSVQELPMAGGGAASHAGSATSAVEATLALDSAPSMPWQQQWPQWPAD